MKLIFSAFAIISIIILAKNSGAQPKSDFAFNDSSFTDNMLVTSPKKKTFEIKVTNVNIKAVRNFVRTYKRVTEQKWFKTEEGYIANFFSDGIDHRVIYTNNGHWFYNHFIYTEDNLPFEIRKMVKRNYYDYNITIVCEYILYDKTVYIITIRDKQFAKKILRICDGEMQEIPPDKMN